MHLGNEVKYTSFPHTITCEVADKLSVVVMAADLDSYTYTVDNLNPYITYTISVLAVNAAGDGHPITTYVRTDQEGRSCGTDTLYAPGVALTVTGVLTLLLTVVLEIMFRRNRRLCCITGQVSKQTKFQSVQLSERGNIGESYTTPHSDYERSPYQQLDISDVAKASVYSELGGPRQSAVYQNDPMNDRDGGYYESIEGSSKQNR
ncbi:uncharacterized protein LOC117327801 [Pecten maximus]|uniref:uncharacterized protein LOC117327801 n=1 Tax=Pecten maximus TaxID=6579 RepID=UPI001458D9C6|nr:uncharacterized protein LOC117327801 [Pecten maximus]